MPLRIAFDVDGVFADLGVALTRAAADLFAAAAEGSASAPDAAPGALPIGSSAVSLRRHQQRQLWEYVAGIEDFWLRIDEIEPGAVAALAEVVARRRWEVLFLTQRPPVAGDIAQVQTQKWLQAKGYPLPSVYVVQGSRGRIAASLHLDYVVDDRPENCIDVVADSAARAILVWRTGEPPRRVASRARVGVAPSVAACLEALAQLDGPAPEGMMERVLRLIGVREPGV